MARQPKTNTNINGNEYFRTRLTIGFDNKGKPIRKVFYGLTKKEAEEKKKDYTKAIESGLDPELGLQTLSNAMYSWLWTIEKNSGNKTSTFERYEGLFRNYINNSDIGKFEVNKINKIMIQGYYTDLIEKQGKSLSHIENTNKLLNKFFRYALSEGYIPRNPLTGLKLPKDHEDLIDDEEGKIETYSDEEINKIIASMGNIKLRYLCLFAVMTGARVGEILALEKKDIKNNIVKINKSIRVVRIYVNEDDYYYDMKITKPKTKSSNREIPLPAALVKELKGLNVLVKEEKLKLGIAYEDNTLLFPSLTGTYLDSRNLVRSWKRALNNANVPYKKFHSLRHTYATRMIENGVSLLTVSRLLGHSSIKTTEIYAHTLEDTKIEAVNTFNSMIQ